MCYSCGALSVTIDVVVAKPDGLRRKLATAELYDLLEEGTLKGESLSSDSAGAMQDVANTLQQIAGRASQPTADAIREFNEIVFWSFCGSAAARRDSDFEPDGIDSSFSPETCQRLIELLEIMGWDNMVSVFVSSGRYPDPNPIAEYLDDWRTIFLKAVKRKCFVFTFIF